MSVAVVTGAGSGVGRALSLELCRRGWSVALLGHGRASLERTAQLAPPEADTHVICVDVADAPAMRAAAVRVRDELGTPRAWINAAAIGVFGPLDSMTDEDLDRVAAVSYNGVVHGSRVAAGLMQESGVDSTIINVGSALAFTTVPYNVAYGASKAAVRSFSLGLGLELRRSPITVSVAHLPAIATPWFTKVKTTTKFQSRPVGPVHTAESVGHALADLVERPRFGDTYLGLSTLVVVIAARVFPRITGWFAQTVGVRLQTTRNPAPTSDNLWHSVDPEVEAPRLSWTLGRSPKWWPRLGRASKKSLD